METLATAVPGLYAAILGSRWQELGEPVRRLHSPGKVVQASGTFRVRRGGRIARVLAWVARLPAECDAVHMVLTVTPTADGEVWHRLFAGHPLVSRQWASENALMEHLGLGQLQMDLEVQDGALRYMTKRVALRLGWLRLPLPEWLAPRGQASETPEGNGVRVQVEVSLPGIGRLVAYDGLLTAIEEKT